MPPAWRPPIRGVSALIEEGRPGSGNPVARTGPPPKDIVGVVRAAMEAMLPAVLEKLGYPAAHGANAAQRVARMSPQVPATAQERRPRSGALPTAVVQEGAWTTVQSAKARKRARAARRAAAAPATAMDSRQQRQPNRVTVFTMEQEADIVSYLTAMEAKLFGMTIFDLREIAFQLAEKNNIDHPFKDTAAGLDWAYGFMKRNPSLSLRIPEATSATRAMGFNKVVVANFFKLLEETITNNEITPDRIYNCDKTGFTVNPKTQSKIIAKKGRRQVGAITSAERGQTVTAEICFSAAGVFVPPMLIFSRVRMQNEFEIGLPPSALAVSHESGWMTKELFVVWFKKFIAFSGASHSRKVLLLFDGHSTHTKNLELIDLARENGVILLCFPPHCSHKLQPGDVSFMKPLMTYYADETRKFLRTNPGKVVTIRQIAPLFGAAFIRAATTSTALNGFKKTGIWLLDPNIFTDIDFMPSTTTDIEILESSTSNNDEELPTPVPGPSTSSSFGEKTLQEIMPIPKVQAQSAPRASRKRSVTAILTLSPYRQSLQETEDSKKAKQEKKLQRESKLKHLN
ncbi:PREDICTED: uncharacterized protein LOC108765788 [Trachymyrmex cornetzi]|uniref:uncharacterized protein LOC108765788 n=1 Tax=Trachymyrmex cornetzi TaxID=471704 RepID=UPI00084F5F98|nr:PREDICTED: uncharacterized protein LOC108765788 [Trachymyrmex cornetzi]